MPATPMPTAPVIGDTEAYPGIFEQLFERVSESVNSHEGLPRDLPAGNNKITGLADGAAATDAVNVRTAEAIAAGGASPSTFPVTNFNPGDVSEGHLLTNTGGNLASYDPAVFEMQAAINTRSALMAQE